MHHLRNNIVRIRGVLSMIGRKVPLTPLGVFVAGLLAWFAWRLGWQRQDRVILAIATIGLGWLTLAIVIVGSAAVHLMLGRSCESLAALGGEADEPLATGSRFGRYPLTLLVRIDIEWPETIGVTAQLNLDNGRYLETIRPTSRFAASQVTRRIRISDPLRMAAVTFDRRSAQEITVLPRRHEAGAAPMPWRYDRGDLLAHNEGQRDGDLLDIRRYSPGDPLKQVLWKTFARTGQVLVRTPERSVTPTSMLMAYFVAGEADEASAGIARGMLEDMPRDEKFAFQADGGSECSDSLPEAMRQLVRSAAARNIGGDGLHAFLNRRDMVQSQCLLFVPARPGRWLENTARAIADRGWGCQVIVGVDGVAQPRHRSYGLLVESARPATQPTADELRMLVERLRAAGADVRVVDRNHGEVVEIESPGPSENIADTSNSAA